MTKSTKSAIIGGSVAGGVVVIVAIVLVVYFATPSKSPAPVDPDPNTPGGDDDTKWFECDATNSCNAVGNSKDNCTNDTCAQGSEANCNNKCTTSLFYSCSSSGTRDDTSCPDTGKRYVNKCSRSSVGILNEGCGGNCSGDGDCVQKPKDDIAFGFCSQFYNPPFEYPSYNAEIVNELEGCSKVDSASNCTKHYASSSNPNYIAQCVPTDDAMGDGVAATIGRDRGPAPKSIYYNSCNSQSAGNKCCQNNVTEADIVESVGEDNEVDFQGCMTVFQNATDQGVVKDCNQKSVKYNSIVYPSNSFDNKKAPGFGICGFCKCNSQDQDTICGMKGKNNGTFCKECDKNGAKASTFWKTKCKELNAAVPDNQSWSYPVVSVVLIGALLVALAFFDVLKFKN